jgi:hypothetical protein
MIAMRHAAAALLVVLCCGGALAAVEALVSCAVDNGGCDDVVSCTDTSAGPACGPCPPGYDGDGAAGCVDYDACAAQPCFPDVHCTDLSAPQMGFTCGACPAGLVGDGVDCIANVCFVGNGGCDASVSCINDPTATTGRVCGACGPGLMDVNQVRASFHSNLLTNQPQLVPPQLVSLNTLLVASQISSSLRKSHARA